MWPRRPGACSSADGALSTSLRAGEVVLAGRSTRPAKRASRISPRRRRSPPRTPPPRVAREWRSRSLDVPAREPTRLVGSFVGLAKPPAEVEPTGRDPSVASACAVVVSPGRDLGSGVPEATTTSPAAPCVPAVSTLSTGTAAETGASDGSDGTAGAERRSGWSGGAVDDAGCSAAGGGADAGGELDAGGAAGAGGGLEAPRGGSSPSGST